MPVLLVTSEAKIEKIMVPGQSRQKNSQNLISTEKAEHGGT
jgi:hypothetical protein